MVRFVEGKRSEKMSLTEKERWLKAQSEHGGLVKMGGEENKHPFAKQILNQKTDHLAASSVAPQAKL